MKTLILLSTFLFFGAMASHAQTTKDQLQKVKADPKTKERAAKADVYIAKQNNVITDTAAVKATSANNSVGNKKKKKKS